MILSKEARGVTSHVILLLTSVLMFVFIKLLIPLKALLPNKQSQCYFACDLSAEVRLEIDSTCTIWLKVGHK